MNFETDDFGNSVIVVRQSWLNDALICNERARLGIIKPDWRMETDVTALGTAVHAAIEDVLDNRCSPESISDSAEQHVKAIDVEFKWTSLKTMSEMHAHGREMSRAWAKDIYPHVKLGGMIEHKFRDYMGEIVVDDKRHFIVYSGTMDYVAPNNTIWDWKTAGRKYQQWEKQRGSVQASVYSRAGVKTGIVSEYPVSFNFGVMTRTKVSEGQIVKCRRTEAHSSWIDQQTRNIVSAALRMGVNNSWPTNDQSALCSEQWCAYWSICKGAHLDEVANRWKP